MACLTSSPTPTSRLFDQHLNCAVCQMRLTNSRILSCQHMFCQSCLQKLACKSPTKQMIACPSCQQTTQLSEEGLEGLPQHPLIDELIQLASLPCKNTLLSDLSTPMPSICEDCDKEKQPVVFCEQCQLFLCDECVAAHQRSKRWRRHSVLTIAEYKAKKCEDGLQNREALCVLHDDERLEVFCCSCQQPTCYKCAVLQHSTCQKSDLSQEYSRKKHCVVSFLENVGNSLRSLNKAIEVTQLHEETVARQTDGGKQSLDASFQAFKKHLSKQREVLLEELDSQCDEQVDFLSQREEHFSGDLQSAMNVVATAKKNLCSRRQYAEFATAEDTTDLLEHFISSFEQPLIQGKLWVPQPSTFVADLKALERDIHNLITIDVSESWPSPSIDHAPKFFLANVPNSFIVKSPPDFGPLVVDVQVETCREQRQVSPDVSIHKLEQGSDRYCVKLVPKTVRKHRVNITAPRAPVSIGHCFTACALAIPKWPMTIIGCTGGGHEQLNQPRGIAICSKGFLVADPGNNRVQEFDWRGKFVRVFQRHKFSPEAVAMLPSGEVLVTDNALDRVHLFLRHGKLCGRFGGTGQHPGQFRCPRGIATTSDGCVVISELLNNRIQLLTSAGSPIKVFSHDRLRQPEFLIVDKTNDNILVANNGGSSIEEFTKDGVHVQTMGSGRSSGLGRLCYPTGLAMHPSGHILVADTGNRRVCIFTREGECVGVWGVSLMKCPVDVACSEDGRVFVVEGSANRVQLYTP